MTASREQEQTGEIPISVERRRADSPRRDIDVGFEAWVARLLVRRAKLVAFATAISSAATCVGVTAAQRMLSADDLSRLKARVSSDSAAISSLNTRISAVEEDQRFQKYLLCVLVRRIDANATPAECGNIVRQGSAP